MYRFIPVNTCVRVLLICIALTLTATTIELSSTISKTSTVYENANVFRFLLKIILSNHIDIIRTYAGHRWRRFIIISFALIAGYLRGRIIYARPAVMRFTSATLPLTLLPLRTMGGDHTTGGRKSYKIYYNATATEHGREHVFTAVYNIIHNTLYKYILYLCILTYIPTYNK